MKGFLILGLILLTSGAYAERTTADITDVFIPPGYDDNDKTVIVVDGYLRNTCYRLDDVVLKSDFATKTFTITQKTRKVTGFCSEVLVPFTTEVSLGRLDEGDYFVVTNKSPEAEKFHIKKALNPTGDDHTYAPLDTVYVRANPDRPSRVQAVIEGRITNPCVEWKDPILAAHPEDNPRILELLPIIEFKKGAGCKERVNQPFQKVFDLPESTRTRVLLHVRSLNGKGFNRIYDPQGVF